MRLILIVNFFFLSASFVHGQQADDYLPPTPTVAALGKYVDAPVSLYTGTPEISIPIYEINCRNFRLPISLSYHAGGFRVEEESSWVGLGWSLNAGGVITRSIRHLRDPGTRDGFFDTYDGRDLSTGIAEEYQNLFYLGNASAVLDGYPDLYIYNFNGHNGKFVYVEGQVHWLPKKPLKINPSFPFGSTTITDTQGNTYHFNTVEKALTRSSTTASYDEISWYLSKIVTAYNEEILFVYKDTEFYQPVNRSETNTYKLLAGGSYQYQNTSVNSFVTEQRGKELSQIIFPHGMVEFISEYDRADIDKRQGALGALRLSKIKVTDKQGVIHRMFYLNQDYFSTGSLFHDKRLKLLSINEDLEPVTDAGIFSDNIKTHSFEYNTGISLPPKNSKAQDHWGYYNAKDNNQSLVPPFETIIDDCTTSTDEAFAATRETDRNAVKADLLTKIIYPTGGFTEFEYECHDYGFTPTHALPLEAKRINVVQIPDLMVSAYNNNPAYTPSTRLTQEDYFTVPVDQCLKIAINIDYPAQYEIGSASQAKVELYKVTGTIGADVLQQTFSDEGYLDEYLTLEHGTYRIKAIGTMERCFVSAFVRGIQQFDLRYEQRKYTGGVRVKRVFENDGINISAVRRYTYHYHDNPNASSGIITAEPIYISYYQTYALVPDTWCVYNETTWRNVTSSSTLSLGSGSHIGYKEVQVHHGENGENGRTISTFTTDPNLTHGTDSDISWRRGLPLTTAHYNRQGQKLKFTSNEYGFAGVNNIYGLQVNVVSMHPCANSQQYTPGYEVTFKQSVSILSSEHFYLKKQTSEEYSNGLILSNEQEFFYDNINHLQPTRTVTTVAKNGKRYIEHTAYPDDFTDDTGFLNDLKTSNIIVPVEKVSLMEDINGSNPSVLGAQLFLYKPGSKGLLEEMKQTESGIIPAADFKFSNREAGDLSPGGNGGLFSPDAKYVSKYRIDYDASSNPVQVTPAQGTPVSYIWGYKNYFPIAKVVNAFSDRISYTGFENDNEGNWELYTVSGSISSRTGKKGFTGTLTRTNLPADNYEIVLWAKEGTGTPTISSLTPVTENSVNGWIRYKWTSNLSGSLSIATNGATIDDVALYPVNSMPGTYTYDPMKGMTSSTDANGRSTFYNFDHTGRLTDILDHNQHIEKHYSYQYFFQGPQN